MWTPFVVSTMRLFAHIEEELKREFRISHLDYGILSQLSFRDDRRVRMSELADRFGVGRSTMTYRVDRLERMGLVERCSVAEDQRGVAAVLTERGADLLGRAAPKHVETVRRLFVDHVAPEHHALLADVFGRLGAPVGVTSSDDPADD